MEADDAVEAVEADGAIGADGAVEADDEEVFHERGSLARDDVHGVARDQGHGGRDGQQDGVCGGLSDGEYVGGTLTGSAKCGIMGAKGAISNDAVFNIFIRSKPKARTDSSSRRTSSTSSRTGSTTSRMTRPGSSGGTASSPTSSALRRTSTLSTGRGAVMKTTSRNKMATVSFQTVKDLVQVYHGLGGLQTNKLPRSQSESSRCGIGREQPPAIQPGLDGRKCSNLIGCAEDGES